MTGFRSSALAMALLLAGCAGPGAEEGGSASPATEAGEPGPDAEGPSGARAAPDASFQTLDGREVTLADLRGRVTIVNFWGTWCLPCRTELPELAELAEAYRERGVRVVGIAIDSGRPEAIRAFAEEYGVGYDLWIGDMATAVSEFGVVGYPFTLLVDREGWIRREYLGVQTFDSLSRDLEPLLR